MLAANCYICYSTWICESEFFIEIFVTKYFRGISETPDHVEILMFVNFWWK